MKLLIIFIYLFVAGFNFFLEYLNYRNRNAPLPDNVKDVYDHETYKKRNAYEMESLKLDIITDICSMCLTLAYLAFDFYSQLFIYSERFTGNVYLQTFFMLGIIMLINLVINTIFDAIGTFKIEEKYGFNKSSIQTFVGDIVKSLIVIIILGGGLLTLFMYLYGAIGNLVFTIFFFILTALITLMGFFYHFFSKIFNKFRPLEEGVLKEKIDELAKRTGYPVNKIFIMDASKRSTKINAYFTGFGKNKNIVLYDTMLEKLDEDEIVSVLAHEIGHAKKKHVFANLLLSIVNIMILLVASRYIVSQETISLAFGFKELNLAFGIYIFFIFYSPISILINIPINIVSRSFEYSADMYAGEHAEGECLISALKKLTRENYSNLTPHPFVVLARHSHPLLNQRIERLR